MAFLAPKEGPFWCKIIIHRVFCVSLDIHHLIFTAQMCQSHKHQFNEVIDKTRQTVPECRCSCSSSPGRRPTRDPWGRRTSRTWPARPSRGPRQRSKVEIYHSFLLLVEQENPFIWALSELWYRVIQQVIVPLSAGFSLDWWDVGRISKIAG